MTVWMVLQVAVPWLWLGMVLAISFLEAPLKFRAPGITTTLGVGIGRLVFRALNGCEAALAVVFAIATAAGDEGSGTIWTLWAVASVVLALKAGLLRRAMDRRATRTLLTDDGPSASLHVLYIAAEVLTVLALAGLGVAVIDGLVG